ncbi:MAG: single-stranded-DNA-specific exonuclease RecJ [Clostridia bacterium]|nr:single-stranded-DNA-specific exonuclease RecJ [Clostridia bacterium]
MFDRQWLVRKDQDTYSFESLLTARGITSETRSAYLQPDAATLEDPSNPVCMPEAVERILEACDTGETITVFGDYDADGITATTILVHFLRYFLQGNVDYYIPDRFTEGYGITVQAVERLKERGTSLILTVDNGIAAKDAVKRARELSMDVIITDHHQCPEQLPECSVMLNPHIPDSGFQYTDLAGVGVAYTLVRALGECIGLEDELNLYFPIVALGTVGDCMPLTGENRILVRRGLNRIGEGAWIGLDALLRRSGYDPETGKPLSATDVAFRIIPKLNAAGRLGHAGRAVELLLTSDYDKAETLSTKLLEENQKRQATEAQIYKEAMEQGHLISGDTDACVIAFGEAWHHGVIGIVASRLVEQYGKPAFVFAKDESSDETKTLWKGSARSIPGFDIYQALTGCAEIFEKFGGHEMAAGLTLPESQIPKLIETLNRYAREVYATQWTPPHVLADGVLEPHQVTVPFIQELSRMEPFGEGNPQPIFIITNLFVSKVAMAGKDGKHLRASFKGQDLYGNDLFLDGIAFGQGAQVAIVKGFSRCSVLCTLEINQWNGIERPSLRIIDIQDFHISLEKRAQCLYNNAYTTFEGFTLNRDIMKAVYKAIVSLGAQWTREDLQKMWARLCKAGISCSWYRLLSAISVFTDVGLIVKSSENTYSFKKTQEKFDLAASSLYRAIASRN